MKASTRDSVIYYWSTRRFSDVFCLFCFYALHFGCLFQANSMKKFIKITLIPSMPNKHSKKITKACKDIKLITGNIVRVYDFHGIYLKSPK